MDWKYALSEPDLGEPEIAAVVDCVQSGWLSMGPRARAFETAFAEMHGVKHAFAVANGTAALHIALTALGVGREPADEVIQPAMNFVAAANMTRVVGAKQVFADIVSLTEPTIDPVEVEKRITANTRAIIVMHYGGYACRMNDIVDIARRHAIPIIEDACHAPGQSVPELDGRSLGSIGDIGCFSFFSNKNMTCGEGGMVVTNNDGLAELIKALRSHGMTTLSWDRHQGRATTYDVTVSGFNYRLDDLRAALANAQLAKLPTLNEKRRALAVAYAEEFAALGANGTAYVFGANPGGGTAHVGAVVVPAEKRDAIRASLAELRIQTSLHYPPVHLFTAFRNATASPAALPATEEFAERVITLPLYPALPFDAVREIVGAIAKELRS